MIIILHIFIIIRSKEYKTQLYGIAFSVTSLCVEKHSNALSNSASNHTFF